MHNNIAFEDAAKQAEMHVRAGRTIHQKFTCSGCGTRQTMATPNRFFFTGECEECKHVTNILAMGCGYVLVTHLAQTH